MAEFNRENVRKALEEAIAEKGADYIYPNSEYGSCVYAEDGQPSCIVGHVVYKLDPDKFEELATLEKNGDSDWVTMAEQLDLIDDLDLTGALQEAQAAQDHGCPWGVALDRFEEELKWNG